MGLKEIMPRVIRHEQNAEIKRRGNTDYLKTDARSKDGWRATRTFNTSTGEWRLTQSADPLTQSWAYGARTFKNNLLL